MDRLAYQPQASVRATVTSPTQPAISPSSPHLLPTWTACSAILTSAVHHLERRLADLAVDLVVHRPAAHGMNMGGHSSMGTTTSCQGRKRACTQTTKKTFKYQRSGMQKFPQPLRLIVQSAQSHDCYCTSLWRVEQTGHGVGEGSPVVRVAAECVAALFCHNTIEIMVADEE